MMMLKLVLLSLNNNFEFICLFIFFTIVGCVKNNNMLKMNSCHRNYYSCTGERNDDNCRCDEMCRYYDDCCYDVPEIKPEENHYYGFFDRIQCVTTVFSRRDTYVMDAKYGFFMVESCKGSWPNDNVKYFCEQNPKTTFLDMFPVSDRSTHLTYKNRQCAKCNGITNLTAWFLFIQCSINFYLFDLYNESGSLADELMRGMQSPFCDYHFKPPNGINVRRCYNCFKYITQGISPELGTNKSCSNRLMKPVYIQALTMPTKQQGIYRNIECWNESNHQIGLNIDHILYTCLIIQTLTPNTDGISLSNLIDISALLRHENTVVCHKTEIHISDKVGCQRIYCPFDMEFDGGKCVAINLKSNGKILNLLFETSSYILYNEKTSVTKRHPVMNHIIYLINTVVTDLSSVLSGYSTRTMIKGKLKVSGKPCSIIKLNVLITHNSEPLSSAFVRNVFEYYVYNFSNGDYLRHVNDVRTVSCQCNASLHNPLYITDQFFYLESLPCPAIQLDRYEGDLTIKGVNITVPHFHLNGVLINSSDVVYVDDQYYICLETFNSKYQDVNKIRKKVFSYITHINTACSCISIVSLVVCLAHFCVIPFMRDGKAQLLVILICFLIISQSCFLLMNNFTIITEFCPWLGMFHHFVWLGTFTFMLLCSYRLNAEIRGLKTYNKKERLTKTVKYASVGVSFPTVIVFAVKMVNIILDPLETWYGGRACFISHVYVLLFAFVIPVFLIVLTNIVIFVLIMKYISASSVSNTNNSNKSNAFLYMKISTTMGFSWIVGLFAVLTGSGILVVIFEIVSDLQGLFISVSFICNARVKTFYTEFCDTTKTIRATRSR